MTLLLRYGTFPLFFLGFNGLALWLIARAAPDAARYALLLAAVLAMAAIERQLPWQPDWNRDPGDARADLLHGLVNSLLTYAGLGALPWLTGVLPWAPAWPTHWPLPVQVAVAVLLLDLGISAAHHASHRIAWLWRFHAVHHAASRLYGFNGWMKHPVHQLVETTAGMAPLLLLGIPAPVAAGVAFAVAIQLLLQHANADYRLGPLRRWFATAELHRHHHRRGVAGDVNFGLFTTLWDHLAGCLHDDPADVPRSSSQVGLEPPVPPRGYLAQLLAPLRG